MAASDGRKKTTQISGTYEPYQEYGRDVVLQNPEMQRLLGSGQSFGQDYQGALGQQRDVYNQYGLMAQGQGPSLVQSQLQAGMGEAERSAVQAAQQARGGNAAGGQLAAANAATAMGGQAATAAAALQAQEQQAAMAAQAGLAGQMAGQSQAGQMGMEQLRGNALQGQLQSDTAYRLGSRDARLQERKMGMEWYKASPLGLISDERRKQNIVPASSEQIHGANPYATIPEATDPQSDPYGTARGLQAAGDVLGSTEGGSGLGELVGTIGGLVALLSDERTKRNIVPGNLAASQAVGSLDPYTFQYEAGLDPTGQQRTGVMAQDLEAVAPQAVVDTPQGKAINTAEATGLNLAATADQEKRLRGLEGALAQATGGPASSRPEDQRFEGRRAAGVTGGQAQGLKREVEGELFAPATPDPFTRQQTIAADAAASAQAKIDAYERGEYQPSEQSRQMSAELGLRGPSLGANSLQQDPSYGYRDQAWSDNWQPQPSAASGPTGLAAAPGVPVAGAIPPGFQGAGIAGAGNAGLMGGLNYGRRLDAPPLGGY